MKRVFLLFLVMVPILFAINACFDINYPPTSPKLETPSNKKTGVDPDNVKLRWLESEDPDNDPITYEVHLNIGEEPVLTKTTNSTGVDVDPKKVKGHTTYTWWVEAYDEQHKDSPSKSEVWEFKTKNRPPEEPEVEGEVVDGVSGVELNPVLQWSCSDRDGDALTYDIYFGTISNPPLVKSDHTSKEYDPGTLNTGTTYYWKIVAKDEYGGKTEGPVWSFKTTQPPSVPSNPDPANGKMSVGLNSVLSWDCSDPDGDALTYDVYFGTDSNPPLVEIDHDSTEYDPGTLNTGTTYYWKVVAKDEYGGKTEGPVWNFKTTQPPSVPSNPDPADGETNVGLDPVLSWDCSDPDGDALTYDVYFGTDPDPVLVKSDHASNEYSPGTLNTVTTYYWKIVAKDGKGGETEGPVWSFTTTQPPNVPRCKDPTNGKKGVETSPELAWDCSDPDGDALTYDVYFGTDPDPVLVKSDHASNEYSPGTLNTGTTYYWKIVAKDVKGGETEGPVWNFTTTRPPSEPSSPNPYDGEMEVSLTPVLSWDCSDPDGDVIWYDIYFGTDPSFSGPVKIFHFSNEYKPGTLNARTTYYWKIVAKDGKGGETEGPVWSFTTTYSGNPPK